MGLRVDEVERREYVEALADHAAETVDGNRMAGFFIVACFLFMALVSVLLA